MTWDFHYQGFPPDLDARYEAARTKAERAFIAAKAGRSRVEERRLLIDVRIIPDVIAWAHCLCELARRRGLRVGGIEGHVDEHVREVARRLCPDSDADSVSFVREVVARVTTSPGWLVYLAERQAVAELLATADSAPKEVERREETTASPAAGAVVESQTEQPIAPLLPAADGARLLDERVRSRSTNSLSGSAWLTTRSAA
jgi:hypothetical protein